MIEINGNIGELTFDTRGNVIIQLVCHDKESAMLIYDELHENVVRAKFEAYKPKRSLDANAYFWTLAGKLSAKLGIGKEDIYRQYVKDVGDNFDTVCVKSDAVQKLRATWERNGLGWITEELPSKIDGCTCVNLYYGSSTYTTAQMARLIDLIVRDCEDNGIQTLTPDQIAELESRWGK